MHHAYLLPDRTETTIDYRPPPVAVLEKAWCTLQTKSLGQLFINYENWWVNYRWRKGPPDASLALDCIAFDSLEQLDLYRYTDLPSHTWNSYNVGRMIFQAICSQCCVASHCCRCHCRCCQHIRTWCQPLSCWARDQLRLPLPIVVLPTLSNCPVLRGRELPAAGTNAGNTNAGLFLIFMSFLNILYYDCSVSTLLSSHHPFLIFSLVLH